MRAGMSLKRKQNSARPHNHKTPTPLAPHNAGLFFRPLNARYLPDDLTYIVILSA